MEDVVVADALVVAEAPAKAATPPRTVHLVAHTTPVAVAPGAPGALASPAARRLVLPLPSPVRKAAPASPALPLSAARLKAAFSPKPKVVAEGGAATPQRPSSAQRLKAAFSPKPKAAAGTPQRPSSAQKLKAAFSPKPKVVTADGASTPQRPSSAQRLKAAFSPKPKAAGTPQRPSSAQRLKEALSLASPAKKAPMATLASPAKGLASLPLPVVATPPRKLV